MPIIALLDKETGLPYLNPEFIERVASYIERDGTEYWDRASFEQLKADGCLPADFPVEQYVKEHDILDVWFDSGVSHWAVLRERPELEVPASLYLEGIDQHRGWFQSSLLTSIALSGVAPMKAIMTHGFTVDAKGEKMSKSKGNVVSPQDIIKELGTDGLRLWVATIGNDGDAVVSPTLLKNVAEVYRKIRNTCRFLLQNLYDFNHATDAVAFNELSELHQYALKRFCQLQYEVVSAYASASLTLVFHQLAEYCTNDLSAFYCDVVKDSLYCDGASSAERRAVQTVFWTILDGLTRLIAPVCSFTAELLADEYQGVGHASIHLQQFAPISQYLRELGIESHYNPERFTFAHLRRDLLDADERFALWEGVFNLRSQVLKAIERQREAGVIKHPLEASVVLKSSSSSPLIKNALALVGSSDALARMLKQLLVVSVFVVELQDDYGSELLLDVTHASGVKCPRCWHWSESVHADGLCLRCQQVINT